jgi:hypothetical protein
MNWMMRAISGPCRIASPRLQSEGRRLISSHSRDFSRNRAGCRIAHNRTPREFPMRASVRVQTIAGGLQIGRTGKATAFPTVSCDPTGLSPSGLKVIGTTGTAAMVVRGISARTAIPRPKRREKAAPTSRHRRAFRLSSLRARGQQARIRPQTRLRPMQSLPPRLSGRPRQVPLFSSSRQAKAAFQPGPGAGGCDRHMDLAGASRENRVDRIRLRKSLTIHP